MLKISVIIDHQPDSMNETGESFGSFVMPLNSPLAKDIYLLVSKSSSSKAILFLLYDNLEHS